MKRGKERVWRREPGGGGKEYEKKIPPRFGIILTHKSYTLQSALITLSLQERMWREKDVIIISSSSLLLC